MRGQIDLKIRFYRIPNSDSCNIELYFIAYCVPVCVSLWAVEAFVDVTVFLVTRGITLVNRTQTLYMELKL